MEYLGRCPCNHHTIVKTIKKIPHSATDRNPQRTAKCIHCGATKRITIIGEFVKPSEQLTVELQKQLKKIQESDPNYRPAEFATADRLVVRLWK